MSHKNTSFGFHLLKKTNLIARQECADDHRGRPSPKLELIPSHSLIQVDQAAPFKTNDIDTIHHGLELALYKEYEMT